MSDSYVLKIGDKNSYYKEEEPHLVSDQAKATKYDSTKIYKKRKKLLSKYPVIYILSYKGE